MAAQLGCASLDALMEEVAPAAIRSGRALAVPAAVGEAEALGELRRLAGENEVWRSYLGMGYHGCFTPLVIQRNILENPGWYTAYTPYQAEISQGRLEALLNFQTMVAELAGMEIANASLLDEATAAAEAMGMAFHLRKDTAARRFVADARCHPQTLDVLATRAAPLGIELEADDAGTARTEGAFGVLLQTPDTRGVVRDGAGSVARWKAQGAMAIVATDPLALALLQPPGEWGADIVVGSAQRFGVPMGYGGPHAAFFATKDEFKRHMPGRIVGVSRDARGRLALRLALQTREQHIRREKATSNICTAQVLLAVMASMYAVYHGPDGLREIAERVRGHAARLAESLRRAGAVVDGPFFDTLAVSGVDAKAVLARGAERRINLRAHSDGAVGVALDETVGEGDLRDLAWAFGVPLAEGVDGCEWPLAPRRETPVLRHPVFRAHRTETEMLRYIRRLESRDLSLTRSMIPLGSCTMKLNATAEMVPVSWPEFSALHPFAPPEQAAGYRRLFRDLESWLAAITGLPVVSLQPNAGSQGEYAGLLAIRGYHRARGETGRNVCLIPASAHGTNPASAVMAGFRVVAVACDASGNVDVADLKAKAERHAAELGALMVTYPSTHGVFEEAIPEICAVAHAHGGQVYLDGANLNALVGLCRPGDFGADVCHVNLHKTFCIPHGGGGPGMGPIAAAAHLAPHVPGHAVVDMGTGRRGGAVSAAPWGSASILPISWMFMRMMGAEGLRRASEIAILNANYIAARLAGHYHVLYKGRRGRVAHECILDLRPLKAAAGVEVEDVAKRLMDYGFHAPTMSWPVPGTLMIEPTESESKAELDRFCDAMIAIRGEIAEIEQGRADRDRNALKGAPHPAEAVVSDGWEQPYGRERAAYPLPWVRQDKFWPAVARIDNVFGDRNPQCLCPTVEEMAGG